MSDTQNDNTETLQTPADTTPTMSPAQKRFYASEEYVMAREALQQLVDNEQYDTDSDYFKSNELEFVERHLYYLSTHPTTKVDGYISNLKLMTRVR
jgi:hypothetical protein